MARDVERFTAETLNPKLLANFLMQLNIARRNVGAYPDGHPVIAAACGKVAMTLDQLLAGAGEFTLGISRDTLLAGGLALDKKHPVYLDLAHSLFDHGLVAVTFLRGLEAEEVLSFLELLARKAEGARAGLEIEANVEDAGIRHIRVRRIDYGFFQVFEEEEIGRSRRPLRLPSTTLWDDLVEGLAAGTVDVTAQDGSSAAEIAPEELAALLNARFSSASGGQLSSYEDAIVSFLRDLDREGRGVAVGQEGLGKVGAFVGRLNPELRRQFLRSTFSALGDRESTAAQLLTHLPEEAVLDTLEELNERNAAVPPVILGILEKLARHPHSGAERRVRATTRDAGEREPTERLRLLLREERTDEYVPGGYQADLHTLAHLDRIGAIGGEETAELKDTILDHRVESRVADIVLEILPATTDPGQMVSLERNLLDLCDYFLELGDFVSLLHVLERIDELEEDRVSPRPGIFDAVRAFFARPEFIEEVLNGLALWGRARHEEIRALIRKVGTPFADPLLDRLAMESGRSLRRLYMECLLDIGEAAREEIIARLGDERWYFVRNLVVLLRHLEDPDILRYIRRFISHSHPRVRQEVLRTFLHFHDPEANRLVLRDLDSPERELRLCAVQLAEFSHSPEVFGKLLSCLHRGGLADFELDLKVAVVRTLAAIGDPAALPELADVIRSKSLLHPILHQSLRTEIVRSLGRYPAPAVLPLLEELARSDQESLARPAEKIQRQLAGEGR